MQGAVIFLWTARLACWPFEVEGQGGHPAGAADVVEPAKPSPAVTEAATPPPPLPPPLPPALPSTLPLFEEARYDIRYGILGSVGELRFSVGGVASTPSGSRIVKLQGSGEGAVLGLGSIRRRIDADFDPHALGSLRWSVLRLRRGQQPPQGIVDTAARADGGGFMLERLTPGEPPARQKVTFAIPTSDPLGLLWRLRTAPPAAGRTETMQLLDGLALWRVQVTTAVGGEILPDVDTPAIRLDGEVAPIFYDGLPDPDRPTRRFTLWLSESGNHLPLRLEVPVGPGDVVMTLIEARTLNQAPSQNQRSPERGQPPQDVSRGVLARPLARPLAVDQLTGPVPGARSL